MKLCQVRSARSDLIEKENKCCLSSNAHSFVTYLFYFFCLVLAWWQVEVYSTLGREVGKKACSVTEAKGQCWKKKKYKAWRKWWKKYVLPVVFRRASDPLAYLKGKGLVWAVTVIGGTLPVYMSRKEGSLSLADLSEMSTFDPCILFSSLALIAILHIVSFIYLSCLLFLSRL